MFRLARISLLILPKVLIFSFWLFFFWFLKIIYFPFVAFYSGPLRNQILVIGQLSNRKDKSSFFSLKQINELTNDDSCEDVRVAMSQIDSQSGVIVSMFQSNLTLSQSIVVLIKKTIVCIIK